MYYPAMLDLKGKKCLVVGGGAVAERKVMHLIEAESNVYVVALKLTQTLQDLIEEGILNYLGKSYQPSFLDDMWLVFAATDDLRLNRKIAFDCKERKIFCNCVSEPLCGSFIVPAYLKKGNLTVSVSTSGCGPALAAKIRDAISENLSKNCDMYLEFMEKWRDYIKTLELNAFLKREIFRDTAEFVFHNIWKKENSYKSVQDIQKFCKEIFNKYSIPKESLLSWNDIWKV